MAKTTPKIVNQKTLLEEAKKHLDSGGSYETLSGPQKEAINSEYSFVTELIVNPQNKGLRKLFTDAVRNEWEPEYFRLQAEKLDWFKSRNASQEWYAINTASAKNKVEVQKVRDKVKLYVRNQAASLIGIDVNSADNAKKIDEAVEQLMEYNYQDTPGSDSGWMAAVPGILAAKFSNIKATDIAGRYGAVLSELSATAKSYGMTISDDALHDYGLQLLDGSVTQDTLELKYRNQAASMWTGFSDRIKSGETVKDIVNPYTQLMSSMLDIPMSSIDFTQDGNGIDPLLQKALLGSANGKDSVMSLADFRRAIKQDARWQNTKAAQQEYASVMTEIMRTFGAGV